MTVRWPGIMATETTQAKERLAKCGAPAVEPFFERRAEGDCEELCNSTEVNVCLCHRVTSRNSNNIKLPCELLE